MTNDSNDPPTGPDGKVLSPEELDITEDQRVHELDDGRYLISGEDDPSDQSRSPDDIPSGPSPASTDVGDVDADAVHGWLADRLEAADSRYGFDITAVFEGEVVRQELFSNDVITTFENLLVWYAQHVGGDTSVEDVLGILLAESTAPIRLPPDAVVAITRAYGVDDTDTIADLHEHVQREGGLRFPAGNDAD